MGKHERQEIEDAENIVVKLLNKRKIHEEDRHNKWYEHSLALSEKIQIDFPDLERAEHIGNIYGKKEIGDIKLKNKNSNELWYLELKMSETKSGKGTLANISQNALTTSNLFIGNNILSWYEFRKKHNFRGEILEDLNNYNYPLKVEKGTERQQIIKKAAYLKKEFFRITKLKSTTNLSSIITNFLNNKETKDIALIIYNIIEKAKENKIKYLDYLKKFKQNSENIKKFVIAMLIGYHTQDQLKTVLEIPYEKIFEIINYYSVYYTNEVNGNIEISRDNLGQEVRDLIDSEIKVNIPKNQTNCLIESNGVSILRIVFHWKNKFQGIQTPCLNIFRES
ncbi:MAG: hypothetical protein P8Y70_13140 [Candidatus Lokiarchaeota archaeon]